MTKRLSQSSFKDLPDNVIRPKYDISAHKAGIVHIGIGAFHRGHQAVFTDDALAKSGGDWRIIGVSLRSANVSEQMNPQDGLYTVTAKFNGQQETRLIGAVEHVLVAPLDPPKVVSLLASSAIKVVTLTVTEKGYHYNMAAHALAAESADIQHDIAHPETPISMPGFIVAACVQRMHKTGENLKFSVISCDNLPENGAVTHKVVTDLARHVSSELVAWIEANVSFSSSMVDRIVPAVTPQDKLLMQSELGMLDEAMIKTEMFKQWVIEDNFCTPIPDWAGAGALIVKNVESYEKLKLRTLNGSHSALAYMGVMLGHKWIHEAIADPLLLSVIERLTSEETGPSLIIPSGFDLANYQQQIIARFQNDEIAYATQQVAMDGSQKMVQRIFAPIIDNIAMGNQSNNKLLTAVAATWMLYLTGKDEAGIYFEIKDPLAEKLSLIALTNQNEPHKFVSALIGETTIIPNILAKDENFTQALTVAFRFIKRDGLASYLNKLMQE